MKRRRDWENFSDLMIIPAGTDLSLAEKQKAVMIKISATII